MVSSSVLILALFATLVVLGTAAAILMLVLSRRPKPAPPQEDPLVIDVGKLPLTGPLERGPQLECYSIPIRLAVLVVAPVGRSGTIPGADQLLDVVDQMVPGLVNVVSEHQPIVRFWPPQISSQGFVHAFFRNMKLPGDRGKGTPWCAVAGKFRIAESQYLVGIVGCAAKPNGLGEVAIEQEGQWNDILRIKS